MSAPLLLLLLLIWLPFPELASCQQHAVQSARIVDGSAAIQFSPPQLLANPNAAAALAGLEAAAAARARAYAGPPALQALDGSCFSKTFERYLYSFCPFHNITYKMHAALVHTKLGDFNRFRATYDVASSMYAYSTMEFSSSEKCAVDATQTTLETTLVELLCNSDYDYDHAEGGSDARANYYHEFELLSMDDASNCKQLLTFSLPLPCSLLLVDPATHASQEKLYEAEDAGAGGGGGRVVLTAAVREEEEGGSTAAAPCAVCDARVAALTTEVASLRDTIAAMRATMQAAA